MVETPSAVLVESIVRDNIDLEDATPKDPMLAGEHREAVIINQDPITTSLRSTKKHLRAVGGRLARFRGISMFMVYNFLLLNVNDVMTTILPFGSLSLVVAYVATSVVLAIPRMTWTHIIVSSPTERKWFSRFPAMSSARRLMAKLAGPTALVALAEVSSTIIFIALLPEDVRDPSKLDKSEMDCEKMHALTLSCFFAGLASLAWTALVTIPATAVLSKIQTALLHEDEDAIIVVDRNEDMGFAAAWKSFDWNARARVYKAYAKFAAIQFGWMFVWLAVVYAQFVAFLGWDFEEKLPMTMYATAYGFSV